MDRLVLATGAMDRTLPFPGWTLPGVFTLGAAQIALKAQGMAIGRRVALVGAGPLLPLVAHQYAKAGATVVAVLDVTPLGAKVKAAPRLAALPATLAKGVWYTMAGALRGLPVRSGVRAIAVEGEGRVEALAWEDARGRRHRVPCDAVGASFGLRSEAQAADLAGCRFVFEPVTRQWQPERSPEGRSSHPHVYLAGDGSGIGGADVAELQGERTAWPSSPISAGPATPPGKPGSTGVSPGRRVFAPPSTPLIPTRTTSSTESATTRSSAAARASPPAPCGGPRPSGMPAR